MKNPQTLKTILVVSNPFGYGPTGQAIAVARRLANLKLTNTRIIIAGNDFEKEIVKEVGLEYCLADTRDDGVLTNLMKELKCDYIFSSQNRFAILAAKRLGIVNAFLDGLSWFWEEIPSDHLIAGRIYWVSLPPKRKKVQDNILEVGMVIDVPNKGEPKQIMVHIGGCQYPRTNKLSEGWLELLASYLSIYAGSEEVLVCGGAQAIEQIRDFTTNTRIKFATFSHSRFVRELAHSSRFITVGGETASFESFALNCPAAFMLPMNLSQWAFVQRLAKSGNPTFLDWSDYIRAGPEISNNEFEAIQTFEAWSKKILSDTNSHGRFLKNMKRLFVKEIDITAQSRLLKEMGTDGASVITADLRDLWQLS